MSKPMSYYEEKYIYTHEAKETKKCPMGWVIVVCIVFLDIMSDQMTIMGKTFAWNANDSFKREMELSQRQFHF